MRRIERCFSHALDDRRVTVTRFPILVLGGYGVFGSRIAWRLARERDIRVIVAGRSREAAEAQAAAIARDVPHAAVDALAVEAPQGLVEALARTGARLAINCAGPFQGQDYAVPETCIRHGVHYIDLADARDFVCDFRRLDEPARKAGVLAVSGASSVPGLSSTVVAMLARDFEGIERIAVGIAPGNRAPRGLAVTAAILGYVGRPVRVREDGRWTTRYGWQRLLRRTLAAPGLGSLSARWFALCDVPDLELFPAAYPSVRTVTFHAGLELDALSLGLWLLSWPVRWGLVGSLAPLARPFNKAAGWLARWGSDRGGMFVELEGRGQDGRRRRRRWLLLAGQGHGPWIPTLPAVILARTLARGHLTLRGAMPCLDLVTMDEFAAEFADFDIRTAIL